MASQSDDSFQLGFATSISQEIIPEIELLVEKQKTLNLLYGSLSKAQKELMRADEEAAKRAKGVSCFVTKIMLMSMSNVSASTKAMLCPAVLSNEGQDIAYVANDAKFRHVDPQITWWKDSLRSRPFKARTQHLILRCTI